MEEKFSWKQGASFPVSAQVAADTIRKLQQTLGQEFVTAQDLLDASRDENAPLHSCFEWDDTIAAELYRRTQAGKIIRSIEIHIVKDDKPPISTRLFVNTQPVASRNEGKFVFIDTTLKNPDYRQIALNNALSELRAFQHKYDVFQELAAVHKAIDDFADMLKKNNAGLTDNS